jgi:small subunit ribosomal protein S19
MAREFKYRGKSLEELQAMSLEDFSILTGSRTRRSIKRGLDKGVLEKVEAMHAKVKEGGMQKKPIRTHRRDFIIIPKMVGLNMAIHRGNGFETVLIQPEMMGHYLGEMALTRKKVAHGKAGIGATRSSSAVSK